MVDVSIVTCSHVETNRTGGPLVVQGGATQIIRLQPTMTSLLYPV